MGSSGVVIDSSVDTCWHAPSRCTSNAIGGGYGVPLVVPYRNSSSRHHLATNTTRSTPGWRSIVNSLDGNCQYRPIRYDAGHIQRQVPLPRGYPSARCIHNAKCPLSDAVWTAVRSSYGLEIERGQLMDLPSSKNSRLLLQTSAATQAERGCLKEAATKALRSFGDLTHSRHGSLIQALKPQNLSQP
jgi:hypothetical protein